MSRFQVANVGSIFEKNRKFVYPATPEIRNQIPLWMKFYCYEYSSTAVGRAQIKFSSSGSDTIIPGVAAKEKAQIWVPAQPNFQTNTNHKYIVAEGSAPTLFPPAAQTLIDRIPTNLLPIERVNKALGNLEKGLGRLSGFNSNIETDLKDAVYKSEGPTRNYEIRLTLPCLTVADSLAAASVIEAFESLSLPTARSLFAGILTRYFHPPLWMFGIGPAEDYKMDKSWSGNPQVCVLKTVTHKKTAFDTNSLAGLGSANAIKPVSYTLSLVFQELEPAFRFTTPGSATSTTITNRSGVLISTGSGIASTTKT